MLLGGLMVSIVWLLNFLCYDYRVLVIVMEFWYRCENFLVII